eukprot:evm.model.scf_1182.2 EVM.evm.TU.scf_1182.2   scf_1182:13808-20825(+)
MASSEGGNSRADCKAVVAAVADALFASLESEARVAEDAENADLAVFLRAAGGDRDEDVDAMLAVIQCGIIREQRGNFARFLQALTGRLGTLVLCGRLCMKFSPPFICKFSEMSVENRQAAILSWARSGNTDLRLAAKALQGAVFQPLFGRVQSNRTNPLWVAMKYPGPGSSRPGLLKSAAVEAEKIIEDAAIDLRKEAMGKRKGVAAGIEGEVLVHIKNHLLSHGLVATPTAKLAANPPADSHHSVLEVSCDAVIVGSGAGAGAVAAVMSKAGRKVILLEKSDFTHASDCSLVESEAFSTMYEHQGLFSTVDGGISVFAGSTVGGGPRINWCASFRTPDHVRKEWATVHGLPVFTSTKYTDAMDDVCKRLKVNTDVVHNPQNAKIKEGFEKLDWHSGTIPRNCTSKICSGHCCFGCAHGEKQDGVNTFLLDAAKCGAKILAPCFANRVVVEPMGESNGRKKKAVGVEASVDIGGNRVVKILIRAPLVVASCGSINTPALLLRSKIACQGNVGKHLRLHPATVVVGYYPRASGGHGSVRSWEGVMMSSYSNQAADWQGSGYGALIEVASCHPGVYCSSTPWFSAKEFKKLALRYSDAVIGLVLCRDMDSGQVTINSCGEPCLDYWPSERDRDNIVKGMQHVVRVLVSTGADTVATLNHADRTILELEESLGAEAVDAYLEKLQKLGIEKHKTVLFSIGTAL